MSSVSNILLVNGVWADGSSWSWVIEGLQAKDKVIVPQFPLSSVVGHSYGGQIRTALGADAPNVVGLVYVAAFGS